MLKKYELELLDFILQHPNLSSSEIHGNLGLTTSLLTTKRRLSYLVNKNFLQKSGKGRATRYVVSKTYKLNFPVNLDSYFTREINEREIIEHFNFDLIDNILPGAQLFSKDEISYLKQLQKKYISNISTLSNTLYKKDLERLGIDLSWKSSQIEGNTYSLLETERLFIEK